MGEDVPRDKYCNKLQTYHEKEFIWLEAFLRACTYMQELLLSGRCRDTVHGNMSLVERPQTEETRLETAEVDASTTGLEGHVSEMGGYAG